VRTTAPDPVHRPSPGPGAPPVQGRPAGQPHVADFTYAQMVTGRFAHTAFAIDTFAGPIPGWECSLPAQTACAEAAIRQAAAYRPGTGTR
jgi:putative transposase